MNGIFTNILFYIGFGVGVATFLTMVVTPLRNIFINWINSKVGTEKQNFQIGCLKEAIEDYNVEVTKKLDTILDAYNRQHEIIGILTEAELNAIRNRITNMFYKYKDAYKIPSYEKKNLIEHYALYKKMHGNSYVDEIYKQLMELPAM